MSRLECDSCGDLIDVSWRTTTLPYICDLCEKDSALAIEQDTYSSGAPCQSALDSVQEEQFDMDANSDINQFDADTEFINGLLAENDDLKMKLSQANLNIQIQGEIIADLENTVGAYRVIFRIPGD